MPVEVDQAGLQQRRATEQRAAVVAEQEVVLDEGTHSHFQISHLAILWYQATA